VSDIRYLREYFDDLDLNGNGTGAPLWEQRAALHPVGTKSCSAPCGNREPAANPSSTPGQRGPLSCTRTYEAALPPPVGSGLWFTSASRGLKRRGACFATVDFEEIEQAMNRENIKGPQDVSLESHGARDITGTSKKAASAAWGFQNGGAGLVKTLADQMHNSEAETEFTFKVRPCALLSLSVSAGLLGSVSWYRPGLRPVPVKTGSATASHQPSGMLALRHARSLCLLHPADTNELAG
jgi:hypothetical protein